MAEDEEVGYTRWDTAAACGISPRTLDRYAARGLIFGVIQYVEGRGYLRLYTMQDIEKVRRIRDQERRKLPRSLYLHLYGQEPPGRTKQGERHV